MSSAPGTGSTTAQAVAEFCAQRLEASRAPEFGIDGDEFTTIVLGVVERWKSAPSYDELIPFLTSLRTVELVLTRACAAGSDTAWELFLNRYRALLFDTAYRIAHDEATARELADSLYAELYGLSEKSTDRASKLLYYSGRGSLEGWLRTIVAQEYVNRYRRTRREMSLDELAEEGRQFVAPPAAQPANDKRTEQAIAAAIAALEAEERFLLASYYLDARKLAEIARMLRVHESTISRKLERATKALRKAIRKRLVESGLSARQADEMMQEFDVRDVQLPIEKSLRQESQSSTFYEGSKP